MSADKPAQGAPPPALSGSRRRQRRGAGASAKVKAKLQTYMSEGKYYEAQQLYHTLYNRLAARGQHAEAIATIRPGVKDLLLKEQANAGGDLAMKIVESLTLSAAPITPENIAMVVEIAHDFPGTAIATPAKTTFLKAAVTWSTKAGGSNGSPQLNLEMARHLTNIQDFSGAQRYWLRADAAEEHGRALSLWSRKGFRGERDLFISRAVLQYCALKNLRDAHAVFAAFQRDNQDMDTPLCHFVGFLLQALQRDARPLFEMLRDKYSQALARDPGLATLLDKIGHVYYGIEPPKGMLDDILGMLKS